MVIMKRLNILLIILLPISVAALEFSIQPVGVPIAEIALSVTSKTNGLSDGIVTHGNKNITAAWLTGPTNRYQHGILGDAIEASGLSVITSNNQQLHYQLPDNAVFEDRKVRLYDINNDGRDELLVVKSYLNRGAAIAIYGVRQRGIVELAESPPIGRPFRWLNPVGAGDFNGDGQWEIAIVETPHIGGILRIYEFNNDELKVVFSLAGFSNHRMGSREMNASIAADITGNGLAELIIPDQNFRALRIIAYQSGTYKEVGRVDSRSEIINLSIHDKNNVPQLLFKTNDNQHYLLVVKA